MPAENVPAAAEVAREQLLGKALRVAGAMEYALADEYKLRQTLAAERQREDELVGTLIEVATQMETVLAVIATIPAPAPVPAESQGKRKLLGRLKPSATESAAAPAGDPAAPYRGCLETALLVLEHRLLPHDVHRVPLLGCKYDEVAFEGTKIWHPWTVARDSGDGQLRVKRVLRSLWIRLEGGQVKTLQQASVEY